MPLYNDDNFALQRLYEKWVVKDEWLLNEEAVPLLMGIDPESDIDNAKCQALRENVRSAIDQNQLNILHNKVGEDTIHKVKPATIYHWAVANKMDLPLEFVNLMNFVLNAVLSTEQDREDFNDFEDVPKSSDIEQILGACLAVVSNYPDECKNERGQIKIEKILSLVDDHSDKLFSTGTPALSTTAIRDIINRWLEKLR